MGFQGLFIWVEGADDLRFFNKIVKPILEKRYSWVQVREYAKESSEYLTNFLKSIERMPADYILVADMNSSPCVTHRKERLKKTFKKIDGTRTVVAIQEIESWYLAGLNDISSQRLGLPIFSTTDRVTKEEFNTLKSNKFDFRTDFMVEILNHFSLEMAKQKNSSFKYFVEKYQLEMNQ